MKKVPRKGKRGASVLLLSVVLMAVLLLLSITMYQVIPIEMHSANRSHQDLNGHYVARAGVQEAMSWLRHQMVKFESFQNEQDLPDYTTDGTTFPNIAAFETSVNARRPFTKGNWRYEIDIIPQQNTMGFTNNFESRLYALSSTAFLNDRPIRRIEVLLRQKTFASFAFYTEAFDQNSQMLLTGESKIFGPVHTNDWFRFNATAVANAPGGGWNTEPYFTDIVTHAKKDPSAPAYGDGNTWIGGAPYNTNGPIAGRYESVFEGGRNDLRQKNAIDLPTSTDTVMATTWPDTASRPTDFGAFVSKDPSTGKVDGGVVINGNAQELNLRLDKFGNQHTVIKQGYNYGTNSKTVKAYKYVSYNPKKYTNCNGSCKTYGTPPTGSGGGGGVGGGNAASNAPCLEYNIVQCEVTQQVENGTTTQNSTDADQITTEVFEITEPVSYTKAQKRSLGLVDPTQLDPIDNLPLAIPDSALTPGKTVIVRKVTVQADDTTYDAANNKTYYGTAVAKPASGSVTKTVQVESIDGQINGNIYASGRIGGTEDQRTGNYELGVNSIGLWGIAKGSAKTDTTGAFVLDSNGNKTYNNKAIITPLNQGNSIALGGDLLQFAPEKFKAIKTATPTFDFSGINNTTRARNWSQAALDPNRMVNGKSDPERSPNAEHALGLISLDIWMKGPTDGGQINKTSNTGKELTAGDGTSDCYFVALAGKTETDALGNPITIAGDVVSSGGFGTWRQHRDNLNDMLGKFRVVGGVIQGTVGKNYTDNNANDTHHWVDNSGSVGYDLDMYYDIEATRQRIFPVQADFAIVRFIEMTARL